MLQNTRLFEKIQKKTRNTGPLEKTLGKCCKSSSDYFNVLYNIMFTSIYINYHYKVRIAFYKNVQSEGTQFHKTLT